MLQERLNSSISASALNIHCSGVSGGPLTVTDANLILGRLIPEYFPALFGPKGNEPLDREASLTKFKELTETVECL